MKIGVKVGDIMTRNLVSVNPETSLKECAKLMIKKRVGSLLLTEKGKLKGLITERDILWVITKKSVEELSNVKAKDIAKRKVSTIKPSADLYDALDKMKKSKYRWLPVIIKNTVVGLLTLKDILRIEPSLFEIANSKEIFPIKEEEEKLKRKTIKRTGKQGNCEECGNFDYLFKIDDILICESCKDSM